jgi:ADP-ribose pyrophosphatase
MTIDQKTTLFICPTFTIVGTRLKEREHEALRHYVDRPAVVLVIPVSQDNCLNLVKQYRVGVDGVTLEFPAGRIENGETFERCGARELQEEMGLTASYLENIGVLETAPHFSNETVHVFVARGLLPVHAHPTEDEIIVGTASFSRDEMGKEIAASRLRDAKTIAAFSLLQIWERSRSEELND